MLRFWLGIFVAVMACGGSLAQNQHYVRGHYQTNPNHDRSDNWSAKGNVNPHTGVVGKAVPKLRTDLDHLTARERFLVRLLSPAGL